MQQGCKRSKWVSTCLLKSFLAAIVFPQVRHLNFITPSSSCLAIIESRLALKSEKGDYVKKGRHILLGSFISLDTQHQQYLFVMPMPSRHMTCQGILSFEKLSTMITSLRLCWKVSLNVGKQIVLPFPNFTTNPAFEKLLTLFKQFQHKVFWLRKPWNVTKMKIC